MAPRGGPVYAPAHQRWRVGGAQKAGWGCSRQPGRLGGESDWAPGDGPDWAPGDGPDWAPGGGPSCAPTVVLLTGDGWPEVAHEAMRTGGAMADVLLVLGSGAHEGGNEKREKCGRGSRGPRGLPLQCFAGCTQPSSLVKLDLSFPTQPG
jgi:hypothetical protein